MPAPEGGAGTPVPVRGRWRRLGAWLRRPWNLVFVALWLFVGVKLAPHLGAIVGVESGGAIVPHYAVTALDGSAITPATLRGKVVLVNFWATWCIPCRAEMPFLEGMYARHRAAGFAVVGFSVDRGGIDAVERFLAERGITYPVAIVGGDVEAAFGGVGGIPTSVLLDRDGRVHYKVVGPLAPASLEPAVRRLLSASAAPTR